MSTHTITIESDQRLSAVVVELAVPEADPATPVPDAGEKPQVSGLGSLDDDDFGGSLG